MAPTVFLAHFRHHCPLCWVQTGKSAETVFMTPIIIIWSVPFGLYITMLADVALGQKNSTILLSYQLAYPYLTTISYMTIITCFVLIIKGICQHPTHLCFLTPYMMIPLYDFAMLKGDFLFFFCTIQRNVWFNMHFIISSCLSLNLHGKVLCSVATVLIRSN